MKNPVLAVLAMAITAVGALGASAVIKRSKRNKVREFLKAIRSGNVSISEHLPSVKNGVRSSMIMGTAGLDAFTFTMRADPQGLSRRYMLGWRDAIHGTWHPVKKDQSFGLHEAFEELLKLVGRDTSKLN